MLTIECEELFEFQIKSSIVSCEIMFPGITLVVISGMCSVCINDPQLTTENIQIAYDISEKVILCSTAKEFMFDNIFHEFPHI